MVTGPALFARKMKCPVGLVYTYRESDTLHKIRFKRIDMDYSIKDLREFIKIHTTKFTNIIEEQISKHPEQWLWLHPRWKTRPPDEK